MSLESFKSSAVGAAIRPVVGSPEVIARMERLSREGRPAVAARIVALPTARPRTSPLGDTTATVVSLLSLRL